MKTPWRIAVGLLVAGALVVVLAVKQIPSADRAVAPDQTDPSSPAKLPTLVEIGSKVCIPCQMMTPILDELRTGYAQRLHVRFLDVQKETNAMEQYNVQLIPTQIFLDADGKELFRHEGFFALAEILAKWSELGYPMPASEPTKGTP